MIDHKTRWTAQKIAQRLALIEPLVYRRQRPLPAFRYIELPTPDAVPPIAADEDDNGWPTVAANSYWGCWQTNFVLRTRFAVPDGWSAAGPIALYLPLGEAGDFSHPEALAYIDGEPFAACDRHHQEIRLQDSWCHGREHALALYGWTGLQNLFSGLQETQLFMRAPAVVQIDEPTRAFVALARVALETAVELEDNEPAKGRLLNALDAAFKQVSLIEPFGDAFYATIPEAHAALQDGIAQGGPPLDIDLIAAGHAHIDVAWLWTLGQTRLKAGRTFHTVLRLMEQFPDYHFTQSQPQLYDYVRQDYPTLLDEIKGRVADGRWEPIGGMWVEADCNLSGGEALARQFLLGRGYFRELFGAGAESAVLWLPDVFGYAWNLPQLIKEAGLDYFFTIKISWNQYNRLPYDSFWWQGLDGTRVLTHFSTTQDEWAAAQPAPSPSTYNANASPQAALSTWRNLQQKAAQKTLLMAFGYGDGGGGPTREMLENIREMGDFPALPRVRHGRVLDFFRQLEQQSGTSLPTWNGELYFEYHRGTYTTQAANKRGNRKSEFLLHDAEFLASWAALATDYAYPHEALTQAWRLLCLNQFHDILPGSSIAAVYAESQKDYAAIRESGERVREEALAALAQRLPEAAQIAAVNPTAFTDNPIGFTTETLPKGTALVDVSDGQTLMTQAVDGGTLVALGAMAPYSIKGLGVIEGDMAELAGRLTAEEVNGRIVLENDGLRLTFDGAGDLISLFDKEAVREVLKGIGNAFQAFEDRPLKWDAWDVDIFYDDKQFDPEPAHRLAIVERGPLRVGVEIGRRILGSEMVQRVYIYRGGRRLDFETWVDWRERHVLLKVAFPVDVFSPTATFEVQWGNVERPTHRNTSWDWARFESCAHKWIDLSEGDYGVSLLNDCKYGHDVRDNVLRLTLLRSPTHPDPAADAGGHRFTYSLFPHVGDWRNGTVAAAYALNNPPILQRVSGGGTAELPPSLVATNAENVIIETVKQAEDGHGLIVRLYENQRCRGGVRMRCGFKVAAAFLCNLLEENGAALQVEGDIVLLEVRPYQVVTVRVLAA